MNNANGKIPLEEWEPLKNLTRQSNVSELLILWYNERVRPVMNSYEQQLLRVLEKWSLTYNNIMLQNIINFFVQQINTDIHHAYFHQSPGLHLLTGPARPANLQMLDSDIRLMKMNAWPMGPTHVALAPFSSCPVNAHLHALYPEVGRVGPSGRG